MPPARPAPPAAPLLCRSEPAYEAHLHLHKVDVPLELFQTWTFVVTPRCRRVDRNCDVVGEGACVGPLPSTWEAAAHPTYLAFCPPLP